MVGKAEEKIVFLKSRIREMCDKSIEMVSIITNAIRNNLRGNLDRIYSLERLTNQLQLDIDEECIALISDKFQDMKNLRFVVSIMKTTAELERIGDQVVNLYDHFSRIQLAGLKDKNAIDNLVSMGEETIRMIESANRSLLEGEEKEAEWVLSHDDIIDNMKKQFYIYSTSMMMEKPDQVRGYLDIILMASNFERIGDLATNIAENAIYSIRGKDIRHSSNY